MPKSIELEYKSVRMMKIRLARRVPERPVGKQPALFLDHSRKPDPQWMLEL
jgi:hypothetical protein